MLSFNPLIAAVLLANAASALEARTATTTSYRALFTVPAAADLGATLQPNIYDRSAECLSWLQG